MAASSAYLVVSTQQVSTCSGSISSYVFPSSGCTGTTCTWTTATTGNAAISVNSTIYGVAGTRTCDGQSHPAIARAASGADVQIGTYACAIGSATLNVPAPCNAPQVEALQPGSRNCDVILYSTSVPSSTPCTEMIGLSSDLVNALTFLGQSYTCDATLRQDVTGTNYLCDCRKQITYPIPVDPAVFPNGPPRSGGCGLPLVLPAIPSPLTTISAASSSLSSGSSAASASSSSAPITGALASLSASIASASRASASSRSSIGSSASLSSSSASLSSSAALSLSSASSSASSSLSSLSSSSASSARSSLSSASSVASTSLAAIAGASSSPSSSALSSATASPSNTAALILAGAASAASSASTAFAASTSLPANAAPSASTAFAAAQSSYIAAASRSAASAIGASLAADAQAGAGQAPSSSGGGGGGGSNVGAIVGGVVGGLAGLLLLLGLLWWCIARRGRTHGAGGTEGYARTSNSGVYDPRVEEDGLLGQHDRPLEYVERPGERGPLLAAR